MTPVNSFNLLKELAQILMPNKFVDDIKPVVKKKKKKLFWNGFQLGFVLCSLLLTIKISKLYKNWFTTHPKNTFSLYFLDLWVSF